MSAGATALTKTLDKIITNVKAVSGVGNSRAYQGKKRFTESEDFETAVRALTGETQAYVAAWVKGYKGTDQLSPGEATYGVLILVKLDKDTTSDCNSMYDLLVAIVAAIMAEASYSTAGAVKPIGFDLVESGDDEEQGISEWELELTFQMPFPSCAAVG